jgi:hypothetical protein
MPARALRLALVAVVVLAVLTPVVIVLRLARDPGGDPQLANLGPERSILDPVPVPRSLPIVAAGATAGRIVQPTPPFLPLRDLQLGVRLEQVPAGATIEVAGRDEAGRALASCTRTVPRAVRALTVTCPVEEPAAVRTVEVAATGATPALRLEAREDRHGLTAGGLYAPPAPRDLGGRLDRALDRLGVLRPPVASPTVLLVGLAAGLALHGAAVLLLLSSGRLRRGREAARDA